MKIRILLGMFISLAALAVAGCGGGGGGGAATVVSGVAAKGLFVSGTVKVYGVNATSAARGDLLKTVALDATGNYSADITPYTGPVIIEVIGTYKDEATGGQVVMDPAGPPLRAFIGNAAGNTTAMVTPLTEVAAKKIETGAITATVINTVNTNIATLFKVADITATKPVDASDAASAGATAAQKDYALALAGVSQLVKNSAGKPLGQVLTDLAADVSGSGTTMADKAIVSFKTALFDFMKSANNKTGVTDPTANPFNAGTFKIALLKISTQGVGATAKVGAIDFAMNLPAGVTVSADAAKQTTAGAVELSGVAVADATSTSVTIATFNTPALRVALANAKGFGGVQFVNVSCTLPAGSTVTAANFTTAAGAATVTATDLTGAPMTGVTLTTTADIF